MSKKGITYYGVLTVYYSNGNVFSDILEVMTCDKKPEDKYKEGKHTDMFFDWYASKKEAEEAVQEAKLL